jgi:uncharacterized membrane protein
MFQKRPFGVTLFLWMVLCLSAWGALRLSGAVRWWEVLSAFEARLSPLYLSVTGAVWMVVGAVLLWSIWAGKRWSYPAIPLSIFLWLVEYWVERMFFQAPRANLTFMVFASVILVVVTLISTFNRKTRKFLLKSEEHEQPEQDSTPA